MGALGECNLRKKIIINRLFWGLIRAKEMWNGILDEKRSVIIKPENERNQGFSYLISSFRQFSQVFAVTLHKHRTLLIFKDTFQHTKHAIRCANQFKWTILT